MFIVMKSEGGSMREIKFRAWDKDAKCFAYSNKECEHYVWGFEDGKLKAWVLVETAGTINEPPGIESVELGLPEEYTYRYKGRVMTVEIRRDNNLCKECGKKLVIRWIKPYQGRRHIQVSYCPTHGPQRPETNDEIAWLKARVKELEFYCAFIGVALLEVV